MTRDRETAQGELVWAAAERLWEETGAPVADTAVAEAAGIDLDDVRDWIEQAAGVRFEITRDGASRAVVAPLR
ncbi:MULTISPECIES: hypothetical protein [unclassified Nocardioides]|uniref:hypothetical protein n=1 Tax=unclassified Nocardioides TaxID=2615069 RepID=UPI0030144D35